MVPLTDEEYAKLKESIKENGQWVPIVCNPDGTIVDGHHRHQVCIELGIEPIFIVKTFPTKLDEKIFAIEINASRRHLDYKGKHLIYTHLKELYEDRARMKKVKDGKKYGENHPKLEKSKREESSSEKAAKIAGLSASTAKRMDHVKKYSPDSYEKIGMDGITPGKAYRESKAIEKKIEIQKEMKNKKIKLPDTITLYNKRFQDADIAPNSVDLIITDPPYLENDVYPKKGDSIFADLGKHAMRVLRDGGILVTIAGHFYLDAIINHLKSSGLKYHWTLAIIHSGKSVSIHSKKVMVSWKPMLMFVKGNYKGKYFSDLIRSEYQGKELHKWALQWCAT